MSEPPKPQIRQARVSDLKVDPKLAPKRDQTFLERLQKAVKGEIPVFFAQVPLPLGVPFDLDHRPDLNSVTVSAIAQIAAQMRNRRAPNLFVYPRGKWFVVSDDYIPLFAAIEERLEYVPCWILGTVDNPRANRARSRGDHR